MKKEFSKNTIEIFAKTMFHYIPEILKYIDETKYLENIAKIIKNKVEKIPDSEIYTNVFSRIDKEKVEKFQKKINYRMIRHKIYDDAKVMGKYNVALDATRFQKAHYEISKEWLSQTHDDKTTWYIAMLEMKLVANEMAIPWMSEITNINKGIFRFSEFTRWKSKIKRNN